MRVRGSYGESVINDAVSIVMYRTLSKFLLTPLSFGAVMKACGSFFVMLFGSTVCGCIELCNSCPVISHHPISSLSSQLITSHNSFTSLNSHIIKSLHSTLISSNHFTQLTHIPYSPLSDRWRSHSALLLPRAQIRQVRVSRHRVRHHSPNRLLHLRDHRSLRALRHHRHAGVWCDHELLRFAQPQEIESRLRTERGEGGIVLL